MDITNPPKPRPKSKTKVDGTKVWYDAEDSFIVGIQVFTWDNEHGFSLINHDQFELTSGETVTANNGVISEIY